MVSGVVGQDGQLTGGEVSSQSEANNNPEAALTLAEPELTESGLALPSTLGALLKTLAALAITALLAYLAVYWLKRVSRPKITDDPHLRVLASAHLGANRFVHIVVFGDQAWLVGSADNSVQLIAEIQDKDAKDQLLLDESRSRSEQSIAKTLNFQALFNRFTRTNQQAVDDLALKSSDHQANSSSAASVKAVRQRRERLRDL